MVLGSFAPNGCGSASYPSGRMRVTVAPQGVTVFREDRANPPVATWSWKQQGARPLTVAINKFFSLRIVARQCVYLTFAWGSAPEQRMQINVGQPHGQDVERPLRFRTRHNNELADAAAGGHAQELKEINARIASLLSRLPRSFQLRLHDLRRDAARGPAARPQTARAGSPRTQRAGCRP